MATILLIDDSHPILVSCGQVLSEAGYQIISCSSGERGLELLKENHVDLIITDIYMPDRDGLDVIREARRTRAGVPVLVMSGRSGPRDMFAVAKALGASGALQKPFGAIELLRAVAEALKMSTDTPSKENNHCRSSGPPDSANAESSTHEPPKTF